MAVFHAGSALPAIRLQRYEWSAALGRGIETGAEVLESGQGDA